MVTIQETSFDILKFRPDPEVKGNETKEIKLACSSGAPWVRKFGHPCIQEILVVR